MKTTLAAAVALTLTAGMTLADEPYLPRAEKSVQRLDINKDGKITPDEIKPRMQRRFTSIDVNGDKSVTAQEFDAMLQKRMEQRRLRYFSLMDSNKDGTITQAEFDRVADDMFDKADADNNGGVDLAELKGFKRADWRKTYLAQPAN